MIHIPLRSQAGLRVRTADMARNLLRLFLSNGGRIAVQLLLLPVLARIVAPDAFGLMAMVMPVIVFATILAEAGLVTGLVRSDVDHNAEASAFWFSTAVGLVAAALVAALAIPFARLSGQARAAPLLLALAPCLVLAGATAVPSARLQRRGEFGAFARIELIAAAGGALAALGAALAGWNAFSLVVQQVVMAGLRLVGGVLASGFKPRGHFRLAEVWRILSHSSPMLGANLLAYLSRSLDNLLIGLFVGPRSLGFYATAYQVIQVPEYVLGASARTIALPAIAQADGRLDAAAAYFASLRVVIAVAAPAAMGCCVVAEPLVRLLLGPTWGAAAPLIVILAPLGLAWSCFQLNIAVLAGLKDTRAQIRSSVLTSALGIIGILAGLSSGVRGIAIGYAVGTAASAIPNFAYVVRALGASPRQVVDAFVRPVASGAVMALVVRWWMTSPGAPVSPLLQVGGAGALGLATYVLAWIALDILTMDL